MRRARWLVLFLIAVIITGLALIYRVQKSAQARSTPPPPAALPESVSAHANDWTWEKSNDGKPIVRIRARDMRQNSETSGIQLEGVELHLFHNDGKAFDRVRSAKADFDLPNGLLFSDGEVEITMGVPAGEETEPQGRLVVIKSSGVHFESKTGKAFTDRAASFGFDRGEGQSVGAQYDPGTRELLMHHDVKLTWRGEDPKAKPMQVEAGSLIYKEAESKVFLMPWSKFRRDTLTMEGGNAVVTLNKGLIQTVEAGAATGVDNRPGRNVEYAADQLNIFFDDSGVLKNVVGTGNARLKSTSPTSVTHVTSSRLDLDFNPQDGDSILQKAVATTDAVVRSEPVPRPNVLRGDTRILRSDSIALYMREGGEEMDRVETQAPGTAEFLPNRPGQKHRTVKGNGMTVEYGADNQVKTFTATQVSTQTENEPVKGKPQPPALTSSKEMAAHFDPKTGEMALLEQWGDFRYQEGDREAKADRAELRQPDDKIRLTGAARVWDPSGSTSADGITMQQKTGDFEAVGNVSSTRQMDSKKDKKNGMLSGDDPVQARAARMTSSQDNTVITYTGDALLWQASNRITADTIRIDRKQSRLEAKGNVITQLLDSSESKKDKKKTSVFTVVRAPALEYDDKTRLAHYTGGATLVRSGMTVTAAEIRAWLKEGDDSSLDHAFADGNVKIVEASPERTRTGTSEHSEYYADESKVVLMGGQPAFVDSVKGSTKGRQITYFANSQHFFVEGEEKKPVESRILRRPR
jgi:lipopolysaccharide export system protein LptA